MRFIRTISALLLVAAALHLGASARLVAAQPAEARAAATVAAEVGAAAEATSGKGEEHGLPQGAPQIGAKGSFITSSMLVSWLVAAFLIVFAQRAMRQVKEIPEGAQNFWEWMVESLHDFLEGIIGRALVKKTFWFFATVFIFILFNNWLSLIPGVGTIGWGESTGHGFHVERPLFRGANADLNMTLAMSLVFFACWLVWAIQAHGPMGFMLHLFAPKGETTGALKALMVVVFFAVGLLEIFSILFRPVSLSFRLYGNIFAGENMLEAMSNLVPGLGWAIPIPFYFMELLVGFVQALVFMLLTAVFTMLICEEDESHAKAHH